MTRMCGRLTPEQEAGYRQLIEAYRVLEASPEEPDREMRLLELDNAFHRRAFELCGMEHHFDHMLASLQHVERIRKFSLQTNENKAVCAAHTRILDAMVQNDTQETKQKIMPAARAIKILEMYLRGCDICPPARTVLTWSIVSVQQVK